MTLTVLITGASGQVGTELTRLDWPAAVRLVAPGREGLDLASPGTVTAAFARYRPGLVINAAAYTAVDRAESEPDQANAVNHQGPARLAEACAAAGVPLIHFSTDYVFDGTPGRAWREDDTPHPATVYGRTKLAGENAIRERLTEHLILRVSWVFAGHGRNFVRSMLRLGGEREALNVVDDQHGCPTPAADVARLVRLIVAGYTEGRTPPWGLYHMAGQPAVTWHAFARAIFRTAEPLMTLRLRALNAIGSAEFPTPAPRPANSVLDCARFEAAFGLQRPEWGPALSLAVRELLGVPESR